MKPGIKIIKKEIPQGIRICDLPTGWFALITNGEFKEYLVFGMVDRVAIISTGGYLKHSGDREFYCRPFVNGEVVTLEF